MMLAQECMSGKCSECANANRKICSSQQVLPNSLPAMANVNNRVEKVDITGTVDTQVGPFLLHAYVKREQAASFKSLVQKCDGKSVVLQVDFSENATIASQCEVQSAHWNHGQATFFKAHAWIKHDTSEGQSMVIVSDDLNHTKYSIYVFMQLIFSHLKTTYPDIEHINIFSDGPTCTANNFLGCKMGKHQSST